MKKVSPLLSILFLVVAAGMLAIRVTLPHCPFQLKSDTPFGGNVKLSLFNETLLRYASIDLTELELKQEIEGLLQGNFPSDARQRSFLSSVRVKRLDVKTMSARRNKRLDVKGMSARGIPMELLSPEFRPVWLRFQRHLQDWSRKRKFQDDIMMDLIKIVKGLNGESIGLERKYRSCAVVGNSGILLKNGYGESIDNHEVVIRLNNAKLWSYENNVGKKTSISFVNSNILHSCARRENCFCHPYGTHVPIAMYICQPAHFLDYIKCSSSHKAPLIVTDPRFDVLCARIVKYYSMKRFISLTGKDFEDWIPAHDGMAFHYSSGMQAVMLAVGVCDKVSIFGFGKSGDAKHHYHTNQKSELGLHDYEAEYDLYRDLVSSPEAIPFISDKFKFPFVSVYH